MKLKHFYLVVSAMLLTLLASCNQEVLNSDNALDFTLATRADEKPMEIDYSALDTFYFVNDKDIESYIHFKKLLAESEKREFGVREVIPMGTDATLCYLINYNNGWEIISADKRATTVLASDSKGELKLSTVPDGIMLWIECLAADVLYLRTSSDRPQSITDEDWGNMLKGVEFWDAINASSEYIARELSSTRGIDDPILIDPTWGGDIPGGNPKGHWELVSTETFIEDYDGGTKQTNTAWCQQDDFNQFCPARTDYPTLHAPAGCSAVAAAQMLYALHRKRGYPIYAPTDVYCTANVLNHNSNNYYTYGSSSTIWQNMLDTMISCGNEALAKRNSAVLISDAGIRIGANYKNDATPCGEDDVYDMFTDMGIWSTHADYNLNSVINNLMTGLPVVMSAKRTHHSILGIDYYTNGHFFLIDYYKRTRTRYKNTYHWNGGINSEPSPTGSNTKVEITYSTPIVTTLKMNWGFYDSSYNHDGFAPYGSWNVTTEYAYDYVRKMMVNFHQ